MKKIVLTILTCVFLLGINQAEAQTLSKSEKKALKKIIKTYKKDPEKWVQMQDRHTNEVKELIQTVADLKEQLAAAKAEKQALADKLAALQAKYVALEKTIPSTKLPDGTVYQVQMGYYKYLDLMSFNEKLKTIKAEEVDGAKRYVIGHFNNMMDALQFSNDMKTLGIEDAFVTEYIDGERNMDFDALKSLDK